MNKKPDATAWRAVAERVVCEGIAAQEIQISLREGGEGIERRIAQALADAVAAERARLEPIVEALRMARYEISLECGHKSGRHGGCSTCGRLSDIDAALRAAPTTEGA